MNDFVLLLRGSRKIMARHGECTKRKYRTKAKANKAMRTHGKAQGCKAVYECRYCGSWHLTSQEQ